jgi:IS30 family transposase
VLVTLVDRKTRETKIRALPDRKAVRVSQACIAMLGDESPLSITFDNGKEFAGHEDIAKGLHTEVYFAKPYRSWESNALTHNKCLMLCRYP